MKIKPIYLLFGALFLSRRRPASTGSIAMTLGKRVATQELKKLREEAQEEGVAEAAKTLASNMLEQTMHPTSFAIDNISTIREDLKADRKDRRTGTPSIDHRPPFLTLR